MADTEDLDGSNAFGLVGDMLASGANAFTSIYGAMTGNTPATPLPTQAGAKTAASSNNLLIIGIIAIAVIYVMRR